MRFEWDPNKAATTLAERGISFNEAATVFGDPRRMVRPDKTHADRFNTIGVSSKHTLFVVYLEKDDGETYRIISARCASRKERHAYRNQP
jgi:uncharacterized DUF497 family protein